MGWQPEHKRRQLLIKNLELVTAPSDTPDENWRPTHWIDRMYYAVIRAGLKNLTSAITWQGSAWTVSSAIVSKCASAQEWFEPLERTVNEMLAERGMSSATET